MIGQNSLKEVEKFLPKCDIENINKAVILAMQNSFDSDFELRRKMLGLMNSLDEVLDHYKDARKEHD